MGRAEEIFHLILQTPKLVWLENDLGTHGYHWVEQARGLVKHSSQISGPMPEHFRVMRLWSGRLCLGPVEQSLLQFSAPVVHVLSLWSPQIFQRPSLRPWEKSFSAWDPAFPPLPLTWLSGIKFGKCQHGSWRHPVSPPASTDLPRQHKIPPPASTHRTPPPAPFWEVAWYKEQEAGLGCQVQLRSNPQTTDFILSHRKTKNNTLSMLYSLYRLFHTDHPS